MMHNPTTLFVAAQKFSRPANSPHQTRAHYRINSKLGEPLLVVHLFK